jgi:hypothetical protein
MVQSTQLSHSLVIVDAGAAAIASFLQRVLAHDVHFFVIQGRSWKLSWWRSMPTFMVSMAAPISNSSSFDLYMPRPTSAGWRRTDYGGAQRRQQRFD